VAEAGQDLERRVRDARRQPGAELGRHRVRPFPAHDPDPRVEGAAVRPQPVGRGVRVGVRLRVRGALELPLAVGPAAQPPVDVGVETRGIERVEGRPSSPGAAGLVGGVPLRPAAAGAAGEGVVRVRDRLAGDDDRLVAPRAPDGPRRGQLGQQQRRGALRVADPEQRRVAGEPQPVEDAEQIVGETLPRISVGCRVAVAVAAEVERPHVTSGRDEPLRHRPPDQTVEAGRVGEDHRGAVAAPVVAHQTDTVGAGQLGRHDRHSPSSCSA
jgi:hypothetical protein